MYCIYELYTVVAMYAHLKTMTTDPGAVPRAALPLPSDVIEMDHEANRVMALKNNTNNSNEKVLMDKFKKTCKRCAAFKPIRAHHCSICGRCVVKMDHHCPVPNQLDSFFFFSSSSCSSSSSSSSSTSSSSSSTSSSSSSSSSSSPFSSSLPSSL